MEWDTHKTITLLKPVIDKVYFSPIGWISGWHGKIYGGGTDNVDLWKTKLDCKCLAIASVHLQADDDSDFNPGDKFLGFGLEWQDDWFIWVRDHTPVGYDYHIHNWSDDTVEWSFKFQP